jgi:predicted nucleic acid-binding protein
LNALVDTNIRVRAADSADPAHQTAIEGLIRLRRGGTELLVAAQNVVEFWNVVTRPVTSNGLGWPVAAGGRAPAHRAALSPDQR